MTNAHIITTVALVLVGLPGVLNAVPDLEMTPAFNALLLVLALIGGVVLKQQAPTGDRPLSDADVARIAAERERLRRIERDQINAQRTVPRG